MTAVRKIQNQKNEKTQGRLNVIKGGLYPTTKRENHIENFWLFCYAAFWNTQIFTDAEKEVFKKLIADHFKNSKNLDVTFKELIERVCLVKRFLQRKKGRYISKPVDWLNINYKNGLSGTKSWYKIVKDQRITVPHYNEGISLLAKAVLKYSEDRNILDMLQYRKELIALKQTDLLQIFMNTVMHIQYFNF